MSKLNSHIYRSFTSYQKQTYLKGESHVTYEQLGADVQALSVYFSSCAIQGERIVIATSRDRILLTCFYAALLTGVTSVILDPKAPVLELSTLIEAADAKGIIADKDVLAALEDAGEKYDGFAFKLGVSETSVPVAKPSFRLFGRGSNDEATVDPNDIGTAIKAHLGKNGDWPMAKVDDEEIAYILFTSGTTSRPKGVMISHRALYAQMQTFIRNYRMDNKSRVMNLLPFHHTDGLTQGGVMCLMCGATFVRPYKFSPHILPQMMQDMYKNAVTHLVTVPSVLALTKSLDESFDTSFDYPEFKFVISTAAHLDNSLWTQCEARFGMQIVNVYGLTETVCETMYCGPAEHDRRVGSVGRPIDSLARIVNEQGEEVPQGAKGELQVAGPHIMSGYFNNSEATEAVLRDGWFSTGDLARCDEDGFYYIVGRKKDLIISGGMNIYPEDVSGVLRSIPGVLDAVTFGMPDEMWGEVAVSCIICDKASSPSVEQVVNEFLKRSSRQRLPRQIKILDEFPRGPAGKVIMSEVRALFDADSSENGHEQDGEAAQILDRVLTIASSVLHCAAAELHAKSDAESVGSWTSLSHVELMLALENEFSFKFKPREIMQFRSLGDAVAIVEQNRDVA